MAAWSVERKVPVEGQLQGPSPPPQKRHLYFTATLEIRDSILSAENAFLHSQVWGYAGLGGGWEDVQSWPLSSQVQRAEHAVGHGEQRQGWREEEGSGEAG